MSNLYGINLGVHTIECGYTDSSGVYHKTAGYRHPALKSAEVSGSVFFRAIRLSPADLVADAEFYRLAQIAVQDGRTYTAVLCEYETRAVVVEAVALVRAEIEARTRAEAKAAAKASRAAEAKRQANPQTADIPHTGDEIIVSLLKRLSDTPDDTVLIGAISDRYQECGVSPEFAVVFATRLACQASVEFAVKCAQSTLDDSGARAARIRSAIRATAGCRNANQVSITVVAGDARPSHTGEGPYSTFKNGGICQYPGAAKCKGYKVIYHADTRAITVGADYVMSQFGI